MKFIDAAYIVPYHGGDIVQFCAIVREFSTVSVGRKNYVKEKINILQI